MNKIVYITGMLFTLLQVVGCGKQEVVIDLGQSQQFTECEISKAIELVIANFNFESCE